jgi:hypothetical protein
MTMSSEKSGFASLHFAEPVKPEVISVARVKDACTPPSVTDTVDPALQGFAWQFAGFTLKTPK